MKVRRSFFILISVLILVILLFNSKDRARGAVQKPLPPLSSSLLAASVPFSLTVSPIPAIPLGEQATIQITIKNNDTVAHTPFFAEAEVQPSADLVPNAVLQALPEQTERVDAQLMQDLADSPTKATDFLVFLADQPALEPAYQIADWNERGRFVYQTLQDHAEKSQKALREMLDSQGIIYQPLKIVNGLLVHGTADTLQKLAALQDVALIQANRVVYLPQRKLPLWPAQNAFQAAFQAATLANCKADNRNICWHVRKVNADRVWNEFGVTGQGIIVANIDSGVDYTQPALINSYRGNRGKGQFEHNYNWYDAVESSLEPIDTLYSSHGTSTMSMMVGRGDGSAEMPAIGVAPGARWIAARACNSGTCRTSDLLKAAEWLLAPTDLAGNYPQPSLRPHIINNSWAQEGGDLSYTKVIAAWRAAGIFPVFANGNDGTTKCGTALSPADYSNVIGVGATDENNKIASFSSIGPTKSGLTKPDLVAPGKGVVAATMGTEKYKSEDGTSFAAPLVAGAVALLWAANPALSGNYATTYDLLTKNSLPITDTAFNSTSYEKCSAAKTPNNIYGSGLMDIYATIKKAKVDISWLQLFPKTSSIQPKATQIITALLKTACLPGPKTYQARILVGANELPQQTPLSTTLNLVIPQTPNLATVKGMLIDSDTKQPIAGKIKFQTCPTTAVDQTGRFTLTLPISNPTGTFYPYTTAQTRVDFFITAGTYFAQNVPLTLTSGTTISPIIPLVFDTARIVLNTKALTTSLVAGESKAFSITLKSVGTQPLTYTLKIPTESFGIWRSDEQNGANLTQIRVPYPATTLNLGSSSSSAPLPLGFAFPFYSKVFTSVVLNAKGIVLLGTAGPAKSFTAGCLPVAETNEAAILPLHADLNPALSGKVSYATSNEGFVISFENIALQSSTLKTTATYTFQVLLAPDGRIRLSYQKLGPLPNDVSAGIQNNSTEIQELGCGTTLALTSGLTLELRPQPRSDLWLSLAEKEKGRIFMGETDSPTLTLQWTTPMGSQPYRSAVLIQTNAQRNPVVRLPVEVTMSSGQQHFVLLPKIVRP